MSWRGPALLAVMVAATGCPGANPSPGAEAMGTYTMHAERVERSCELTEVQGGPFDFEATFSRTPDTDDAWVAMNGYARPGAWDGQVFVSTAEARRVFPSLCSDCLTTLDETLVVVLLSRGQSEASGNRCPEHPLEGGLPGSDAGVGPPQATPLGFDAVRACGELSTRVRATTTADGGACAPECSACRVRYVVVGERR